MTLEEARQALEAAGFQVVEPVTEESDDVAAGRVDPHRSGRRRRGRRAGRDHRVRRRRRCAADLRSGVEVPFVIGASESSARQAITDAGLEVEVVYIDRPAGDQYDDEVMDQDPRVPARLEEGDVVTINVGRAADPPEPTTPRPTQPQPTQPQPTQPQPTQPQPTQPTSRPTTQAPTTTQRRPPRPGHDRDQLRCGASRPSWRSTTSRSPTDRSTCVSPTPWRRSSATPQSSTCASACRGSTPSWSTPSATRPGASRTVSSTTPSRSTSTRPDPAPRRT